MIGSADWCEIIERRMCEKGLSHRKREVVWHVLAGLTVAEIASALFISERTVKNHIWQVYDKLSLQEEQGSTGRTQLALFLLYIDIKPLRTNLDRERTLQCTRPLTIK